MGEIIQWFLEKVEWLKSTWYGVKFTACDALNEIFIDQKFQFLSIKME
jgi:hypothetical protein